MKKIIALFVLAALSACGVKGPLKPEATASKPKIESPKVEEKSLEALDAEVKKPKTYEGNAPTSITFPQKRTNY